MRKFYYPTKDASIYEEYPTRQTGMDEVLEVGKTSDGTHKIRSLIELDLEEISASISSGVIPSSSQFEMKFFAAEATRLDSSQVVNLYPVSQSWLEGQGYFYQMIVEEGYGATWKYRDTGSLWSITGSSYIPEMGVSSSKGVIDLSFDVTPLVLSWLSGSVPNYGGVLKFSNLDEAEHTNKGNYKLFSRQTHTVYSPMLVVKWDDSIYNTGSMEPIPDAGLTVYPSNLRPSYKVGEITRVNLVARASYPIKSFTKQFTNWEMTSYLPRTSYFSIVDVQSKEVIIPFDEYSKISMDSTGPFVRFEITHMYPHRYYTFMTKVLTNGGYEYVFDNNYIFMVSV